ncbi:hypothetical protein T484DRAFT_3333357 [Baffinella frigidus]|nr:hypothetical protein T484DRAFT_3333357 [Cryptophyta sp. CCMP2293]
MAPLAHTRGGGCRSASPRPHLFLSLIVMLSALFVPASGFLVSPGGVLPRSGSGAMHSATRSGRLQPAGGLLVNVRRGARFQSSTSETFGCALSVAPDEEEERKRQFEVQRGKAVDTLLTDYPVIFSKQCDFSIFDPAIVLSDAQGFHVEGIRAHRTFFSAVPMLREAF